MTTKELKFINRTIKAETLRFCGGLIPSMDEIGELSIILAAKTAGMVEKPCLLSKQGWTDVVGNTIMNTIAKYVA